MNRQDRLTTDPRKLAIAGFKIALNDDQNLRDSFKYYSHSKEELKANLIRRATDFHILDHLIGSLSKAIQKNIPWDDEAYENLTASRLRLKGAGASINYRLFDFGYIADPDPDLTAAIMSYDFGDDA